MPSAGRYGSSRPRNLEESTASLNVRRSTGCAARGGASGYTSPSRERTPTSFSSRAPRTGCGDRAGDRFLLFEAEHGRPAVRVVLGHSIQRVALAREREGCARCVLEGNVIPLDGDLTRTGRAIPPLEGVRRVSIDLKRQGGAAARGRVITGDVREVSAPCPAQGVHR